MSKSKPLTQTYHILDKGMRYVGAIRLKPGQKTVLCTEAEAKFFLEGGALSLTDPAEAKAKAAEDAKGAPEPEPAAVEEPEGTALVSDETATVADKPATPAKAGSHKAR